MGHTEEPVHAYDGGTSGVADDNEQISEYWWSWNEERNGRTDEQVLLYVVLTLVVVTKTKCFFKMFVVKNLNDYFNSFE